MAQTHPDYDRHMSDNAREFMEIMTAKAKLHELKGISEITGGRQGEKALMEYDSANGVHVRRMPDDENGLLRLSIGGGNATPVNCDYFTFRGKPKDVIQLLRKALTAIEEAF